ncbi:MAG: hypothetical protein RBS43_10035 [Candidatus Cloacimonas sp.]|jgi:hypothetical protein|nr:hypothetical protein [Candidatus Cloacimonas sp.]
MKNTEDYISPIFEHSIGDNGRGILGFTEHKRGKPFANHIRLFNKENRTLVLAELQELFDKIQRTDDEIN